MEYLSGGDEKGEEEDDDELILFEPITTNSDDLRKEFGREGGKQKRWVVQWGWESGDSADMMVQEKVPKILRTHDGEES